jgi:uncharacterized protein (TIRG00374 family)
MNKRLRIVLQYIFFLGIGGLFAWLSLRNLNKENMAQIRTALREARHWLIIPVFFILFMSHFVRALRWRLLIQSLGYNPSKANTFFAVMIGYMTNQALPRVGEVLKCTVLGRYEKIPVDKLIGTIILERMVDAITLLIIFAITLALQPQLYTQLIDAMTQAPAGEEGHAVSGWLIFFILAAVIIAITAIWMIRKKKNFHDLLKLLKKIGKDIWQGISSIRLLKKRWLFIFLSIALWTCYLIGGYFGFLAMRDTQHYGIPEAFTVLSAGSIGMVVSPGGIGAYAYLIQQTMMLYNLNSVIALAFGWILWMVQTAVIVLGGLISFVAIPYYNKKRLSEPF